MIYKDWKRTKNIYFEVYYLSQLWPKSCFMLLKWTNSLSLCTGAAAENMLGSLLCPHGSGSVLLDPYGSTISETTSEAWSVEVLPSDSGTNLWLLLAFAVVFMSDALAYIFTSVWHKWGVGTPGVPALHSKTRKKEKEREKKRVHASVIIFLCMCLSFSVNLCQ